MSVKLGPRQCSQNDSGRISGDLSCMCPVASVAGLIYPSTSARTANSQGKQEVQNPAFPHIAPSHVRHGAALAVIKTLVTETKGWSGTKGRSMRL